MDKKAIGGISLLISIFLVMNAFIFCEANTGATREFPLNWPWKGVTVNNLSVQPSDIADIKNILTELNSVRLTIKPRLLALRYNYGHEEAWKRSMVWLDQMLDVCKSQGISAIISVNEFPINPDYGLKQFSPQFWRSKKHRDDVIHRVKLLTKQFSTRGSELAAFEVLSEPVEHSNNTVKLPKEWPQFSRRIIKEIREITDRWVVITPGAGGLPRGYKNITPFEEKNIVYGAHVYTPNSYSHQGIKNSKVNFTYPGSINGRYWDAERLTKTLRALREFQINYNVPVWIGEFSAVRWAQGSEKYLKDLISIFDRYGWGWAYFNIGGMHAWNPNYNNIYPGNEKSSWKKQYVGTESQRWGTLKALLGGEPLK